MGVNKSIRLGDSNPALSMAVSSELDRVWSLVMLSKMGADEKEKVHESINALRSIFKVNVD